MVIQKDNKTGKYYIAPSPKSFYKSKPSTSTKGSSGGFSSRDPTLNTNPEFDRNIGGIIIHGRSSGEGSSGGFSSRDPTLNTNPEFDRRLSPRKPSSDINKGYLGANPNIENRGVLTVTKKEAQTLQGSGVPYWVQQSETPSEAIQEGSFAGSIPQIYRNINTRELYEYNIQNILAGQETYKQYRGIVSEFKEDPKSFENREGVITTSISTENEIKNIDILKSGGVRVNNITYHGNSKVPGINKTANQIQNETFRDVKKEYPNIKKGSYSVSGTMGGGTTSTSTYQLTPEYFDNNINYGQIQKDALVGAKQEFRNLPFKERSKLNIAGYGQGLSSAVIGIGEFGGTVIANMGMATTNKEGKFEDRSFRFGGTLGEIRNYPSTQSTVGFLESPGGYLKQKGSSPETLGQATVIIPLLYQGVKLAVTNIKTLGWGAGAIESVSGVSPFRIKSGVYSQPITKDTTFGNVKSIKGTSGGITTRIYSGSSGDIKLYGAERSSLVGGKRVGGGATYTQTPTIEISGGGAYVTRGTRTTLNPYVFGGGGSGAVYGAKGNNFFTQILTPSVKGGTSTIIASKGSVYYTSPRGSSAYSNFGKAYRITGGGASEDVAPGIKDFISGKATPQYKTKIFNKKHLTLDLGPGDKLKIGRDIGIEEYGEVGKGIIKADFNKRIPIETRTINKIISEYSIDTFGSRTAYSESFRVLKPGGKIKIVSGREDVGYVSKILKDTGFKQTKITKSYIKSYDPYGRSYKNIINTITATKPGTASKDFVYAPSGKYKLTPTLRGREYDINAILGRKGADKGYTSFKGGGSGLKGMYKFGDEGVSTVIPIVKTGVSTPTQKIIPFTPSPRLQTQTSQYAGLGLYERTYGGMSPAQTQIPKIDTGIKIDVLQIIIPKIDTGIKTGSRSRGRSKTKLALISSPAITTKPKIDTGIKTQVIQVRRLKINQQSKLFSTMTSFQYGGGGYNYNYPPTIPTIPLPIPLGIPLGMGGGSTLKLGNVRPRRTPTRYTPSFKALFFKIRGKDPGGVKTGFRFRPITPGFSFFRKRKIKVRKVKI